MFFKLYVYDNHIIYFLEERFLEEAFLTAFLEARFFLPPAIEALNLFKALDPFLDPFLEDPFLEDVFLEETFLEALFLPPIIGII
jgi:hypothetical protein